MRHDDLWWNEANGPRRGRNYLGSPGPWFCLIVLVAAILIAAFVGSLMH